MNTIKIFLAPSGGLARLDKDFPLYQFQYNNKLLNVFVPTSITVGQFWGAVYDSEGNVIGGNRNGYTCLIRMSYTNSYGHEVESEDFLLRYVKTLTQNGVEYALFERTLPYAFTTYEGTNPNQPKLIVTVANIVTYEEGVGDVTPYAVSKIEFQEVGLDVLPSTDLDIDEPIVDPGAAVEMQAEINALQMKMGNDVINPNGLNHDASSNINQLYEDTQDIPDMKNQIAQNAEDIDRLEAAMIYGMHLYGDEYVINSESVADNNREPTQEELITYIETEKGSTIAIGDACWVYWNNYEAPDAQAIYYWNGTSFNKIKATLRRAGNGITGTIEGNFTDNLTPLANQLMVDITAGEIVDIYKVNADGTDKVSLKSVMTYAKSMLMDGNNSTPVPKALNDSIGRQINLTYSTKSEMKGYVQNYASPKALYDLNYADYAAGLFKDENDSGSAYHKQVTSTQAGDNTLSILTKVIDYDLLLGDQNGVTNKVYLRSSLSEEIQLRITTSYIDADLVEHQLGVELTPSFYKIGNKLELYTIETIFDGITTPITLESGTTIKQVIEVVRQVSTSVTYDLVSDTTYPSYMTFNKIGFVRYALEDEPQDLELGADDSVMLDNNNNLQIVGNGQMGFVNGSSQPIVTITKVPMAADLTSTTEIKPPKAGDVASALGDKLDKMTGQPTYARAYALMPNGTNSYIEMRSTKYSYAGIVRDYDGRAEVAAPVSDDQIANKKYVDDLVAAATDVIDISTWTSPITDEQLAEVNKQNRPILYRLGVYFMPIVTISQNLQWGNFIENDYNIVTIDTSTKELTTGHINYRDRYGLATNYAPNYDNTSTYAVNDLVVYSGKLYKCNTAITTAEDWTAAHWTAVDIKTLLANAQSQINSKLDKVTSVTTYHQAYVKNNGGAQSMINYSTSAIAGGLVQRDLNGQISVPSAPSATTDATSKDYVDTALAGKVDVKPDGTNDLISNNKVSTKYLPDQILGQLLFGGNVNANTAVATLSANAQAKLGTTSATITLTNDTTAITGYSANNGIFYVVATAGTFAGISYKVGDWLISLGTKWDKIDNTDEVTSVQVQASGGLTSSTSTAQTGVVSTTIGVGSSYKLPTTTEWGNKLDKVTGTTTYNMAYVKNADGTQTTKTFVEGINGYNGNVSITPTTETWTFTLADNTTVTKTIVTGITTIS